MLPPSASHLTDVDTFLRDTQYQTSAPPRNQAAIFNEFETIYNKKHGPLPSHHATAGVIPASAITSMPPSPHDTLRPFFHSFIHSIHGESLSHQAALQHHLSSLSLHSKTLHPPSGHLSIDDKCRVRDRSMILARQIFADQGSRFADHTVDSLLHSLQIDPLALPASADGATAHALGRQDQWDAIYNGAGAVHAGIAVDHAASAAMIHAARTSIAESGHSDWAAEFESKARGVDSKGTASAWVNEYDSMQQVNGGSAPGITTGNGLEASRTTTTTTTAGADWVDEFKAQTAAGSAMRQSLQGNASAAVEQTKKLAETLSSNRDPKFQNSKFLQFVSKMSKGELIIEDNAVREAAMPPPAATASQWADEFGAQHAHHGWASEFLPESSMPHQKDWVDEFSDGLLGVQTESPWTTEFLNSQGESDVTRWEEEYLTELEKLHSSPYDHARLDSPYAMAENNPFLRDTNSFVKGKDLFKKGILSEAVLAFEAECQRNPGNSEAWRLLGTVHSENDDDVRAIAALNRALAIDPGDLDTLLSLGVSHTNELETERAVSFLRKWIMQHPTHSAVARQSPPPADSSQAMAHTMSLFHLAAAASPQDADVRSALGVLCTMTRRYDEAIDAFRAALERRPGDYSLWNKLGATLANSGKSSEALSAYQHALELKPNYMRAWTNMGISLANLGDYMESSKYYVRALALNRNAVAVWGYLRTSLSCAAKEDLLQFAEDEDINALQRALPL